MSEQLTIQHAIAARLAAEGMGRALDRAELAIPTWGDLALAYIKRYALQHERFAGWMLVQSAANDPNFPAPPSAKAWGHPIRLASLSGIIERVGTTKDPNRHCNPIPLWRSLIYTGSVA